MALDYAKTADERAAVALIAGPGARLTGRFGARAKVPGTTSRPYHPGIDIAGAAVGAQVAMFAPRSFAGVWYSSKDAYGALDLFLGDKNDGLRYVHNSRNVHTKGAVAKGSTVAYMGATGNVNGVHVHLERYENGALVDPLPWLISLLPKKGTAPAAPAPETKEELMSQTRLYKKPGQSPTFVANLGTGALWIVPNDAYRRHLIDTPGALDAPETVELPSDRCRAFMDTFANVWPARAAIASQLR